MNEWLVISVKILKNPVSGELEHSCVVAYEKRRMYVELYVYIHNVHTKNINNMYISHPSIVIRNLKTSNSNQIVVNLVSGPHFSALPAVPWKFLPHRGWLLLSRRIV